MIEDFVNEVLLALEERHKEPKNALLKGVGILTYDQYREMVGECRGLESAAELLRDIAKRWNNG